MYSFIRLSTIAALLVVAGVGLTAYGQNTHGANMYADDNTQSQTDNVVTTVKTTASDSAITTDVKTRLLANPGTKGFDIHVETNHGVVTLHGTVRSKAEEELAERIAKGVDGVKAVTNDLTVKDDKQS